MAFTKKQVEARKDWLTQGMLERRERREAGLFGFLETSSVILLPPKMKFVAPGETSNQSYFIAFYNLSLHILTDCSLL